MDPEGRQTWLKKINRAAPQQKHRYLEPSKCHRVCSEHFVDGQPTSSHPHPELKLGYTEPTPRTDNSRHQRYKRRRESQEKAEQLAHCSTQDVPSSQDDEPEQMDTSSANDGCQKALITALRFIIFVLLCMVRTLKRGIATVRHENIKLKGEASRQKQSRNVTAIWKNILKSDTKTTFYTGLSTKAVFLSLHRFVSPFVKRRWRGAKNSFNMNRRKFRRSPKKFGPDRKLTSEDECLLTLMRLRLGILNEHLADIFNISPTLCSQIFQSWLTAMDKVLDGLILWPTKDQVHMTKPARYRAIPGLRAIIDCSEIFIETPKDLRLQSATWSDYKHHNTGKFLIAAAPNSMITYVSPVYNGRASDKAITLQCRFLDKLDAHDVLQADKGFAISDECAIRNITLHMPPGKRGQVQMSSAAVQKTKRVANFRILIEQVIRRLKTFRILKYELPISLIPSVDKIVKVCAALTNLKEPIYKT